MNPDHRQSASELSAQMEDAHQRTLSLVDDLSDEQWLGPYLEIVNPPLWEVGHVGFFYEAFVLRNLEDRPLIIENGNELFNSFVIAHRARWNAPLPDRRQALGYLDRVRGEVVERLAREAPGPWETYLALLSVYHEDMHGEAFMWTRQTHGYPTPQLAGREDHGPDSSRSALKGPHPGDVHIPGGLFRLGGTESMPFVFDNEKWAHPVQVEPFRMAKAPVTNEEFAQFVDDGGYGKKNLWDYEGWVWREETGAGHPGYWRKGNGGWEARQFDRWEPLSPHQPVIHVNWYEAEAFCRWAGRRLPSEAEWELAASAEPSRDGGGILPSKRLYPWGEETPSPSLANLDGWSMGCLDVAALPEGDSAFGCRQMMGNVWEWTSSPFYPFPGYLLDQPYKEYSAPWFGYRKVLRGGAWPTRGRMLRNSYRNFFTPDRRDVFAGFRTCAL